MKGLLENRRALWILQRPFRQKGYTAGLVDIAAERVYNDIRTKAVRRIGAWERIITMAINSRRYEERYEYYAGYERGFVVAPSYRQSCP